MIIATRILTLRTDSGDVDVPVDIHKPEPIDARWRCAYEIGWPGGARRMFGAGEDAVQALYAAMQNIGIELYTSEAHKAGRLGYGGAMNNGYGFPLAKNVRDLLVGMDKEFM